MKPSRRARKLAFLLATAIVVLLVAGVVIWRMTWIAPAWYAPPDASSPAITQLADRVEYRLVQESQQIRSADDRVWTLRIHEDHINAWLAARLRKWVAHHEGAQWPAQLGTPQVHFEPQRLTLAIPILDDGAARYVIARVEPIISDDKLRLELHRVQFGRVSLPGEPLAHLIQTLSDAAPESLQWPQVQTAINWLRQRESVQPVIELSDGRRIRVMNLRINDGTLDITAETLD